ncbi:MAG: methyltransferase domain-containing protein, partial [Candidatus Micrarchaeota archaeon]|nr:methyltransferase domain-containing protein [Candidatus Micrarchaeota archaeon]
ILLKDKLLGIMGEKQISERDKELPTNFMRDKPSAEAGLDPTFAKEYLNKTTHIEYYKKINMGTPESFIATKAKLEKIKPFLKRQLKEVVSIGVGAGEELQAAASVFNRATISGIDLVDGALRLTKENMDKYGLKAELIRASGTQLPFAKESVDVVVESATLHEIYSYMPNGKLAWKRAIQEVANCLAEDGVFLLRDFSAPSSEIIVTLTIKPDSQMAEFETKFYDYFRQYYRVFESWTENGANKIEDRRAPSDPDYPEIDSKTRKIKLTFDRAAEFLLHYRNFYEDHRNELVEFRDPKWKEINETYLPPNPDKKGFMSMPKEEYIGMILEVANLSLAASPYKIVCVKDEASSREETTKFLMDGFSLTVTDDDTKTETELFNQITEKMELIFKKVRR